ncbi:hypothetical protein PVAG01_11198 [Phlyctema vagabunda]|uniref:Uncharacterized protein n=1 Tax=Phlyctema vagabunda TaxID=108571 RepID=A0ABR4P1M3_9HELO
MTNNNGNPASVALGTRKRDDLEYVPKGGAPPLVPVKDYRILRDRKLKHNTRRLRRALRYPTRREVQMRPNRTFKQNASRPIAEEAYLLQERGSRLYNCEPCDRGLGPFEGCVTDGRILMQSCANCHYAGRNDCDYQFLEEDKDLYDENSEVDEPEGYNVMPYSEDSGEEGQGKARRAKRPKRRPARRSVKRPVKKTTSTAAKPKPNADFPIPDTSDAGILCPQGKSEEYRELVELYNGYTQSQKVVERINLGLRRLALDHSDASQLLAWENADDGDPGPSTKKASTKRKRDEEDDGDNVLKRTRRAKREVQGKGKGIEMPEDLVEIGDDDDDQYGSEYLDVVGAGDDDI